MLRQLKLSQKIIDPLYSTVCSALICAHTQKMTRSCAFQSAEAAKFLLEMRADAEAKVGSISKWTQHHSASLSLPNGLRCTVLSGRYQAWRYSFAGGRTQTLQLKGECARDLTDLTLHEMHTVPHQYHNYIITMP